MQVAVNIAVLASLYALVSCGYVLIYRVSRVLSLAHGELMMLGAYGLAATAAALPGHPLAAIGVAGLRLARVTTDPFVRTASAATVAWLLTQALLNIGAVLQLVPITGIPLPLVSYGGSSLVPTLVACGMLMSFARAEAGRPVKATRSRRPARGR